MLRKINKVILRAFDKYEHKVSHILVNYPIHYSLVMVIREVVSLFLDFSEQLIQLEMS
jgi:hypothetical protein